MSGPSEALKACNRQLVDRIKRQLSDESAFSTFKQTSGQFMRGAVGAGELHGIMVSLGLLNVTAELAALCPQPARRAALLAVHRAFLVTPAAQDSSLVGRGWMPPEAAMAQAQQAESYPAWECGRCTLINAPGVSTCENCALPKRNSDALFSAGLAAGSAAAAAAEAEPAEAFPALPSPSAAGGGSGSGISFKVGTARSGAAPSSSASTPQAAASSSSSAAAGGDDDGDAGGGSGKKGKKGKGGQTFRIGLPTAQAPAAAAAAQQRVHPGNVWTQNHAMKKSSSTEGFSPAPAPKGPNQWKGAGAGKVAKVHGAINAAWDKA